MPCVGEVVKRFSWLPQDSDWCLSLLSFDFKLLNPCGVVIILEKFFTFSKFFCMSCSEVVESGVGGRASVGLRLKCLTSNEAEAYPDDLEFSFSVADFLKMRDLNALIRMSSSLIV